MNPQNQPIWTRSFLSIFMASLLVFTAFYLLLPTLPLYLINGLHISAGYTGIVLAVYTVAALIIRPFTGFMLDLYGRKWIYLSGLILFSLLFSGYIFVATLAGMLIIRFVHGLFWGITTTSGSTIAVDLVPAKRRGEGLGYFGLASTIPMAIGPMLGLQLVSGGNYNQMFLVSIILAVVGVAFAFGIKYPELPVHTAKFSIRSMFEVSALPVAAILFINMITYGGVVSFVSLYVKETGVGNAGMFFMNYAIGIALSRIVSGKIFDRRGPGIITTLAFISIIIGFLILALYHNNVSFLFAAFMMGLGGGVLFPICQAMVNNMVLPHRRGAANSTLFTVLDLGIGCGMMLTGYLAEHTGLVNAFIACSVINVVALILFMTYSNRHYMKHKLNHAS
ncbi:MAG: MFS transporter [Bacteroidales bacterium]|nr:MFS transporter [Bacteroidales bacterium]